jgi:hypothetical protein
MFVGDVARRTPLYKTQSCFRCFSGPNFGGDDAAPCTDARRDFEGFPTAPCPGGIRSNVLYPTCWDGKNLDSPNHKDHVAYPTGGPSTFLSTGNCPASHPVKIPQLMLEIVWDTTGFNDKALWPATGQPFVLSTGDTTGYGLFLPCALLTLHSIVAYPNSKPPNPLPPASTPNPEADRHAGSLLPIWDSATGTSPSFASHQASIFNGSSAPRLSSFLSFSHRSPLVTSNSSETLIIRIPLPAKHTPSLPVSLRLSRFILD